MQPLGLGSFLWVGVSASGLCNVMKLPHGVTRCTTVVTLLLSDFYLRRYRNSGRAVRRLKLLCEAMSRLMASGLLKCLGIAADLWLTRGRSVPVLPSTLT